MDSGGKSATLPAGLQGKPQPKLSSHSFSGGFLGRLKRRFRLKSKGYEFHPSPSTNVQGMRIQWTPERESDPRAERKRSEGAWVDVSRTSSDRSSEFLNPTYDIKQPTNGKRKGAASQSTAVMCNKIGRELQQLNGGDGIVRNDYLVSEDSVIDLEEDVGCIREDVFDDMDPGYETLDEIRRKMHIRTAKEQKDNTETGISESVYYRPKVQQHRRSQSSGHQPTSYQGEASVMRDSGLGSPLVSDASSSMRTSDMMRESMSIVSDTDISSLGFHHLCHSDYAEADSLLSPTSNLGAMKMNSCPGNATNNFDTTPACSQDFVNHHGIYNSDTYLAQCQQLLNEDGMELYANPKILMRKKTQREQVNLDNGGFVNSDVIVSDQTFEDSVQQTDRNHHIVNEGTEACTQAPPIPERKYSLYLNQISCDNSDNINNPENSCHGDKISATKDSTSDVMSVEINRNNQSLNLEEREITDQTVQEISKLTEDNSDVAHKAQFDNVSHLNDKIDTNNDDEILANEIQNPHVLKSSNLTSSVQISNHVIELSNQNVTLPNSAEIESSNQNVKLPNSAEIESSSQNVTLPNSAEIEGQGIMQLTSQRCSDTSVPHKKQEYLENTEKLLAKDNRPLFDHSSQSCLQQSANVYSHFDEAVSDNSQKVSGTYKKCQEDRVILSGDIRSLNHTDNVNEVEGVDNNSDMEIFPWGSPKEKDISNSSALCSETSSKVKNLQNVCHLCSEPPSEIVVKSSGLLDNDSPKTLSETQHSNSLETTTYHDKNVSKIEECCSKSKFTDLKLKECEKGITRLQGSCYTSSDKLQESNGDCFNKVQDSSTECPCDSSATDSTLKGLSVCSSDLSPFDNLDESTDLSPLESLADSNQMSAGNASEPTSESTPNIELSSLENCSNELSPMGDSNELSPVELVPDTVELSPFGSVVGSAGSSSDRLSEPLSNIQVMSYEDSADAVLESMYPRSDSFAEECDSNLSPLSGHGHNAAANQKLNVNKVAKESSETHPKEESVPPSDDSTEPPGGETASAKLTSRLPDYYYQDTEPVHMSLSELGIPDQWPTETPEQRSSPVQCTEKSQEPTHMSLAELGIARNGHPSVYSTSSYQETQWTRIQQTRSLPPSHPTFNVYEQVDNDPGSGDSLELYQENHDGTTSWQMQGNSFRHSWSPLVTTDDNDNVRDEEFLRRLDARPPALVPKRNHEGDIHQDFMESMRQLKDCGWYWGPLSWDEAEIKLINKPDGSFLVRDSSDDRYILSLSFNMQGRVHHTRIEHHKGKFSFWSQPDSHGKSTIREFIEQCVRNSRNGQFLYFIRPSGPGSPPMPVHLLYPVSRNRQMRSLQHMCRFRILQGVRRDHIDRLPIPTRIKEYLKDPQYYVEYLEDD